MAINLRKPIKKPAAAEPAKGAKTQATAEPARKSAKRERERKTERMDIRVTPTVKEFVQHIMDVSGYTAGDLLLEGARVLLRDLKASVEVERPDYRELRIRRPSRNANHARV